MSDGLVVEAVTFDLDDTLYPQAVFLEGAWDAVADAAPAGVDRRGLRTALGRIAARGSDRGGIIDRAVGTVGAEPGLVPELVAVFRAYRPDRLPTYPGVLEHLAWLRARVPIGLVTDGDEAIQIAKLEALGLVDVFDVVVLSDAAGRSHRKPSPHPFRAAVAALGRAAHRVVHVGDRPAKDVAGAKGAGLVPVRVRSGEYRAEPDLPGTRAAFWTATEAMQFLAPALPGPVPTRGPRPEGLRR